MSRVSSHSKHEPVVDNQEFARVKCQITQAKSFKEKGKILYMSGQYEGEYHQKLRHGQGIFQFKNGSLYEGEWKKGLKHGKGKFIYCDGSFYNGDWKLNKKHGFGKYVYENGDVYEGSWRKDVKNGLGTYTFKEAQIAIKGNWMDGILKGPIEIFYQNFRYYGSWYKSKPVGEGVFSFGMKHLLLGHIEEFFKGKELTGSPSRETLETDKWSNELACIPHFIALEITRYEYSKLPMQLQLPQSDSDTTICTQSSIETSESSTVYDSPHNLPLDRCHYYAL